MKHVSTTDWHEWRRQGIGASDASIIMRAVPEKWGTIRGLWMEKTNHPDAAKRIATYVMKRGKLLEPRARAAYEKETGLRIQTEVLVQNVTNPVFRATLDGLSEGLETRVMEGKCPGKADHEIATRGRIPPKYVWQCAHTLMTTELDRCDYWSFYKGNGVLIPYFRDEKIEKRLREGELRFWESVENTRRPEHVPSNTETRVLGEGARIFQLRRTR
jgi:putative phage-type endonuclease